MIDSGESRDFWRSDILDPADDWDEIEPDSRPVDIWDAFELDDDLDEPLPEYGDFWSEPNEEET